MADLFSPPGIERREERTLEQIALEMKQYLLRAEEHKKEGAAYYRLVGERLNEAKAKMPHGQFLAWLQQHFRGTPRHAQRYMKLAKCDTVSHLDEQWQIVTGRYDGEAEPQPSVPTEKLACRFHRNMVSPPGYDARCPDCRAMNNEAEPPKPGREKPGKTRKKAWKFCRLCKTQKKQDCLDCEEVNGRIMTDEEVAEYFPPREPGDDTEVEEAAAKYDDQRLKKVFRSWFQEVKKIAKTYGLKWADRISDCDPRFKRAFHLHCQARDALRDLLHELQEGKP